MSINGQTLLEHFCHGDTRNSIISNIVYNIKKQIDQSIVRKLLFSYKLNTGILPLSDALIGDLYIDSNACSTKVLQACKFVLPLIEIHCNHSATYEIIRSIKDTDQFVKIIETVLANRIITSELNCFIDIISNLYKESQTQFIKNSNELIDILRNDKFKYVFCKQITQKSEKLIRLNCIESGTYFAVNDISGDVPIAQDLTVLINDTPPVIGHYCSERIGMLITKPALSIKFIDQDYFERMYTNKFKFMMEE